MAYLETCENIKYSKECPKIDVRLRWVAVAIKLNEHRSDELEMPRKGDHPDRSICDLRIRRVTMIWTIPGMQMGNPTLVIYARRMFLKI